MYGFIILNLLGLCCIYQFLYALFKSSNELIYKVILFHILYIKVIIYQKPTHYINPHTNIINMNEKLLIINMILLDYPMAMFIIEQIL